MSLVIDEVGVIGSDDNTSQPHALCVHLLEEPCGRDFAFAHHRGRNPGTHGIAELTPKKILKDAAGALHRGRVLLVSNGENLISLTAQLSPVAGGHPQVHGENDPSLLVFEDALGGFEAAHRAGMKSIGIATVNSIEEILQQNSVVEAHKDFSSLNPQQLIEKYLIELKEN